jgi:hypothetical protein
MTMAQNTTTFSPLDPARRTLAWQVGAVLAGSLILTLSSQVAVPMYPVPMTLQTLAVTLIGALYPRPAGLCQWRCRHRPSHRAHWRLSLWVRRRGGPRGILGRARLERPATDAGLRQSADRQRAMPWARGAVARGHRRDEQGCCLGGHTLRPRRCAESSSRCAGAGRDAALRGGRAAQAARCFAPGSLGQMGLGDFADHLRMVALKGRGGLVGLEPRLERI